MVRLVIETAVINSEKESFILEMQGELTFADDCPMENFNFGSFKHVNNDHVELTIGKHVLVGRRVELKKPLALLKVERIESCEGLSEAPTKFSVERFINYKYLFNTRPKNKQQ